MTTITLNLNDDQIERLRHALKAEAKWCEGKADLNWQRGRDSPQYVICKDNYFAKSYRWDSLEDESLGMLQQLLKQLGYQSDEK